MRGFGQEEKEGVRVVVRGFCVCLVMFGVDAFDFAEVIWLEVLFFYGLTPGSWVRRSRSRGDLRVLRQTRLSKQACSTRLPSPTFVNGLVSMWRGHGQ